MENNLNKYIAVAYKLYTVDNGESKLVEEATDKQPFQFISGYGITLDAFEKEIAGLDKGAEFDFTLQRMTPTATMSRSMCSTLTRIYSASTAILTMTTYIKTPSYHCRMRTATGFSDVFSR